MQVIKHQLSEAPMKVIDNDYCLYVKLTLIKSKRNPKGVHNLEFEPK